MKILSATDHSLRSKPALEFSFSLAKDLKSELIVLNVFDIPPISPAVYDKYFKVAEEEEKQNSINKTSNFIDELDLHFEKKTVDHNIHAAFGDPKEVIIKEADKLKVDLIIAGSKGKSAIEKLIFGSTSSKIFGTVDIPVLAVPENAKYTGIKKIIFHSDYSDRELNDLIKLCEMFRPLEPTLICIVMKETQEEIDSNETKLIEDKIRNALKCRKIDMRNIVTNDQIESLNSISQFENADILTITTKQRTFFENLFNPSKAKQLCFQSTVPLLTMNK